MAGFNEDTRVKIPAIIHLTRLGHLSLLPAAHPLHPEEKRQGRRGGAYGIPDGKQWHRIENQAAHHR